MDVDHDTLDQLAELTPPPPSGQTTGPGSLSSMSQPSASAVAEAFEKRLRQQREEQQAKAAGSFVAFDEDHETRQEFRRLIDPAILRPNPRPLALESLKVMRTSSDVCRPELTK